MSKYSRTRKAICRISHLSYWIINRTSFKKMKVKTWKESFRVFKKSYILIDRNNRPKYPNVYGIYKPIPNKYKDMIKEFDIWKII